MRSRGAGAALLLVTAIVGAQAPPPPPPTDDVNQFYEFSPDSLAKVGVPKGTINGPFKLPSQAYPGTLHDYWIYVRDAADTNGRELLTEAPRQH